MNPLATEQPQQLAEIGPDFFLTAAQVLPVLVLALLVEMRVFEEPSGDTKERRRIDGTVLFLSIAVPAEIFCLAAVAVPPPPFTQAWIAALVILGVGFGVREVVVTAARPLQNRKHGSYQIVNTCANLGLLSAGYWAIVAYFHPY